MPKWWKWWPSWHRTHDWEFVVFAGGWAVFMCTQCKTDTLSFARWKRCPGVPT